MVTLKKQNINKSKKNVKSRNKFSKSRKSVLKSRKNMVGGMFEIFKSKSKSKPSKINQSKRPLPTIPGEKPTEVIKPNMFHRLAGKVGYNTKTTNKYYDNLINYKKAKNLYDLKQLEESRRQHQMREQKEALESQKKTDENPLVKQEKKNIINESIRKQKEKRQEEINARGPNVSYKTINYEPLSELELQQQKNNNDIKQNFAKEASNYALQSLSKTKYIPTGKELRPAFNISNLSKMSKPNYDEYIKQYDEYRKKYFDEKILEVNLFKKLTANGKDRIQPYLEDIIKIKDKNLDPTETEKEIKDLFININVKFPSYINKDLLELLPKAFASFSSEKIKEIVYKTNIKENIDRKFTMENLEF